MKFFTGLGDVVVAYPEYDKVARLSHPQVWEFTKYCLSVKPKGEFANPQDFELALLHRWREHLIIVDDVADIGELRYRYYGADVVAFTGFDMTGRLVRDFDSEAGRFLDRLYRKCLSEKILIHSEHYRVHARGRGALHRVLCPVRDGEQTYVVTCFYPIPRDAEPAERP